MEAKNSDKVTYVGKIKCARDEKSRKQRRKARKMKRVKANKENEDKGEV